MSAFVCDRQNCSVRTPTGAGRDSRRLYSAYSHSIATAPVDTW